MKKIRTIVLLLLVQFFYYQQGYTQAIKSADLLGKLHGTWIVTNYRSNVSSQPEGDTLVFHSDGVFRSTGIPFGVKEGIFTTDETRSVVIVEIEKVKTEWLASVRKGILRFRSVDIRKSKVYLTLRKIS